MLTSMAGSCRVQREVIYWFRPRTIPAGSAPAAVREQWIGVPLPVRRPRPAEGPEGYLGLDVVDRRIVHPIADGVAVDAADAIAALRFFGRDEAASWWEEMLVRRPATESFVFRRHEGDLLPPTLALMLHPELEDFDEGPAR